MNKLINKLKNMERSSVVFFTAITVCSACIITFLIWYFNSYGKPYMQNEIVDLSAGWRYETERTGLKNLETLRTGVKMRGGEKMTLFRELEAAVEDAAILVSANHQAVNVYLDEAPLYIDRELAPEQNPGMALHYILLPKDYFGKTLKIELTSPYELYAGRTRPVLLGTIPSLEAYTLSRSMRPVILMSMSLLIGLSIIALTFVQALRGLVYPQNLAIGVFGVIWAFYYVCTEYITYQFFSPYWVSTLSLGLYFTFQVPLTLYFYYSFKHYQKWMLPAVILHGGFAAAAVLLQIAGIVDFPRLLNINNVMLTGLIYTVVLAGLEVWKRNRIMMFVAPLFMVAYVSMLLNFIAFYGINVVPYSYRDTFFLLMLGVLIYNIWDFFRNYYRSQREAEFLAIQNRQAEASYRQIKDHLNQVGGLKHEIKNHITALRLYLNGGQYKEAEAYLERYASQAVPIAETIYNDNFLINAVVSGLMQRAGEYGVKVDLNLKAAPTRIADHDFYSLLTNITNNALEACAAVPEGEKRYIRLSLTRRGPYLNVRCQNGKAGEIVRMEGQIQTNKPESGHGFGLWTVERIVDAYDGLMDIDYNEDTFTITAALKDK